MCLFWIKLPLEFANPKKACRGDTCVGVNIFFFALGLDGLGFLPFAYIISSKYSILDLKKSHISKLSYKPYCFIFSQTSFTCLSWCTWLSLLIKMTSSKAITASIAKSGQ